MICEAVAEQRKIKQWLQKAQRHIRESRCWLRGFATGFAEYTRSMHLPVTKRVVDADAIHGKAAPVQHLQWQSLAVNKLKES